MADPKDFLNKFYPAEIFVTSESEHGRPLILAFATAKEVARQNDLLPTRAWIYKRDRLVEIDSIMVVTEPGKVPGE